MIEIMFLARNLMMQTATEALNKNNNIDESSIPALAEILSKAVMEKNYFVISGVVLMFAVFVMRKFLLPRVLADDKLKTYTPAVTIIISLIIGIATWLLNPKLNVFEIIMASISSALVASGTWETFAKPVSKLEIITKIANKNHQEEVKKE